MNETQSKAVADLAVGDFAVWHGFHECKIVRIERTTATQIILGSGTRFSRKDGYQIGDHSSWSRPRLSVSSGDFVQARFVIAMKALKEGFPMTQDGVQAARLAADAAEAALRESGKWS